jgi:cytochrome P450
MGMSFAMIESQIILGILLSRFRTRLATQDTIAPQTQVTLRPDQPVLLALEKIG